MSDGLIDRDMQVLWHPCSQMSEYQYFPPIVIEKAAGSYLYGADGTSYIDGISSWWCKAFGHCHPHLQAALQAQSQRLEQIILANTVQENQVRLCERLLAAANGQPCVRWAAGAAPGRQDGHFGKVFLADNGSTGMEVALKMALQAQRQRGQPQRHVLAGLAAGYHGETIATLAVGDVGLYGDVYRSLFFDSPKIGPVPVRSGPTDPAWQDCASEWAQIEAQLAPLADTLAAICYEPILQGAGGMRVYSPDLLRRLRAWADAHGVYLIADEIAAGSGRCGTFLASHLAAADFHRPNADTAAYLADFVVVSKGITGGSLPLSAVLVPDAIYDLFLGQPSDTGRAFLHSNTYAGNGLAAAVANACLDLFAADGFFPDLQRRSQHLQDMVRQHAEQRPGIVNVRGVGMLAAFDVQRADGSPYPPDPATGLAHGRRIFRAALDRGAWLRNLGSTIYLMPPLNTSDEVLDDLVTIAFAAVDAAAQS